VPKSFVVDVLEPDELPPVEADSDDPTTPSPPRARMMKRTFVHDVLVHVSEVVDRGPVDLTVDTTHTHKFTWFGGCVDGTIPVRMRDDVHCFGGHNANNSDGAEKMEMFN
jgi:hypothetical protein